MADFVLTEEMRALIKKTMEDNKREIIEWEERDSKRIHDEKAAKKAVSHLQKGNQE